MKRRISSHILHDLNSKIVFITGPRQCGKTTLSLSLDLEHDYLNYDSVDDRLRIKEQKWDRTRELIIFDELHKMRHWKRWLKGIYDVEGIPPRILVTGSARFDTFRKVGDSLAGRFFNYQLHPFDLKEVKGHFDLNDAFERLMTVGGFPEPFLNGQETYYKRWSRTHADIILREDLFHLKSMLDIQSMEILIRLLRERVGQTISYANLARDLEKDPNTIKQWLEILEGLYIIYRVTPYSKNIARSLLKSPKFYFYDSGQVIGDNGIILENIVANALLKECHLLRDTKGIDAQLHFLRTKDGVECDFLITQDYVPTHMLEVKWADDSVSPSFGKFSTQLPSAKKIQLVQTLKRPFSNKDGVSVSKADQYLSLLDLA